MCSYIYDLNILTNSSYSTGTCTGTVLVLVLMLVLVTLKYIYQNHNVYCIDFAGHLLKIATNFKLKQSNFSLTVNFFQNRTTCLWGSRLCRIIILWLFIIQIVYSA